MKPTFINIYFDLLEADRVPIIKRNGNIFFIIYYKEKHRHYPVDVLTPTDSISTFLGELKNDKIFKAAQ